MATSRTIDDVEFTLYGYKNNKWLTGIEKQRYIVDNERVYAKVDDKFSLNDIKEVSFIWLDRTYREGFVGFKLKLKDGDKIKLLHMNNYLPYHDDINFYPLINEVIELAERLNIDYGPVYYSVNEIVDVMQNISNTAIDHQRMLNLLKGKELFTLVDDLDRANCKIEDLESDNTAAKDEITKLKLELKVSQDETTGLKLKLAKSQRKVAALESVQEKYKQDILTVLRETLSKM